MFRFITPCLVLVLGLSGCKDNGNPIDGEKPDGEKPPCPPIEIVPPSPYDSPVWHPSGQFIGFNHTPLKEIRYPYRDTCFGEYLFQSDSAGFWLINADGSNMRRIFPYKLLNPAWSPDGQWIAFSLPIAGEAHIFKMRFTGTTFDTTTVMQLTSEGRNFFPAWSPDGRWLAYSRSICEGPNTCGIWIMSASGQNHRFLAAYGNYPDWHRYATRVLYLTPAITGTGQTLGDSLWLFDISTNTRSFFTFLGGINRDNRYPRYAPDGAKIAFQSNVNLWLMDADGTNQRQLTTHGVGSFFGAPFSWSPIGNKIVYNHYQANDWTMYNGVLWLLDVSTGIATQLSFNP